MRRPGCLKNNYLCSFVEMQCRERKTDIPLNLYILNNQSEQKILTVIYQIYQEHVIEKGSCETKAL